MLPKRRILEINVHIIEREIEEHKVEIRAGRSRIRQLEERLAPIKSELAEIIRQEEVESKDSP